jgi:outer membrane protein OmpA-like peptidoglycan-associated protein
MPREPRRIILERRATFVQAALAGIVGCGEPRSAATVTPAAPATATSIAAPAPSFAPTSLPAPAPTVVVAVCLTIIKPPAILFAEGAAEPLAGSEGALDELAFALRDNPGQLCPVGFDAERPIAPNDTAVDRAKNRRVELRRLEPNETCDALGMPEPPKKP